MHVAPLCAARIKFSVKGIPIDFYGVESSLLEYEGHWRGDWKSSSMSNCEIGSIVSDAVTLPQSLKGRVLLN